MDKQVSESAEICEDKRANKKKPLALQSEKHLPSIDKSVNPTKDMTLIKEDNDFEDDTSKSSESENSFKSDEEE